MRILINLDQNLVENIPPQKHQHQERFSLELSDAQLSVNCWQRNIKLVRQGHLTFIPIPSQITHNKQAVTSYILHQLREARYKLKLLKPQENELQSSALLSAIKNVYDNKQTNKANALRHQYRQEMQNNMYCKLRPIIKPRQPPINHLITINNQGEGETIYDTDNTMKHFETANHQHFNQSESTQLTNPEIKTSSTHTH